MPFRMSGITISHDPASVDRLRYLFYEGIYRDLTAASTSYSLSSRIFLSSALPFWTHALCHTEDRGHQVDSDSTGRLMHPLYTFWHSSAIVVGLGTTNLSFLALKYSIFISFLGTSSSTRSFERKLFSSASSIGPMKAPTTGMELCI